MNEAETPKQSKIDPTATVQNSRLESSALAYMYSSIVNSTLGKKCSVGDFSRCHESTLAFYNRIDRFCLILDSTIGAYTYTGTNTRVIKSTVGKFCSIAWNVSIGPADHDPSQLSTHDFMYNDFYNLNDGNPQYDRFDKPCTISNDVWIGANATILRGITIGNGAVIGANSVVTKNVPAYAIVAGTPAKLIRHRFSPEIIKTLEKSEWWNLPYEIIKENFYLFSTKNTSALAQLKLSKY